METGKTNSGTGNFSTILRLGPKDQDFRCFRAKAQWRLLGGEELATLSYYVMSAFETKADIRDPMMRRQLLLAT